MKTYEVPVQVSVATRDQIELGQVFRYLNAKAKPGLRMTCETPEGKDGLYSVRLCDGVLMHSKPGSDSACKWQVQQVQGAFVEGASEDEDTPEDEYPF